MKVTVYDGDKEVFSHEIQVDTCDWKPLTWSMLCKREGDKVVGIANITYTESPYRFVKERWYHRVLDRMRLRK